MDEPNTPTALAPATPPPVTAEDAAAAVLNLALGVPGEPLTATLSGLRERVQALRDPQSPQALDELRRQVPVLEALWHRFAAEALRAKGADARARLLRAALQAQQAHTRTLVLVHTLNAGRAGGGGVTLHMGDADDGQP